MFSNVMHLKISALVKLSCVYWNNYTCRFKCGCVHCFVSVFSYNCLCMCNIVAKSPPSSRGPGAMSPHAWRNGQALCRRTAVGRMAMQHPRIPPVISEISFVADSFIGRSLSRRGPRVDGCCRLYPAGSVFVTSAGHKSLPMCAMGKTVDVSMYCSGFTSGNYAGKMCCRIEVNIEAKTQSLVSVTAYSNAC